MITASRPDGEVVYIVGSVPCIGLDVVQDPWISLKITWTQGGYSGNLLYCMYRGVDGGYIELKLEAKKGAFYQLIVVAEPPSILAPGGVTERTPIEPGRTPLLDLSPWGEYRNVEGEIDTYRARSIDVHASLRCWRAEARMGVVFSDADRYASVNSGDVSVGYSADGVLVDAVVNMENVRREYFD